MNLQTPLATLLLDDLNVSLKNSGINPVIVSGLDAMGRVSDNEKMLQLFNDLAIMSQLPEPVLARFKFGDVIELLANGRDVDVSQVLLSDEEFQQMQAQAAEAEQQRVQQEELAKRAEPEAIAQSMQ